MRNITVVTFADPEMEEFCQTLHYSMEELKSGNHNINYVCGTKSKNFEMDNFEVVSVKTKGRGGGCHGYLIARTMKHLTDVDIVIICDCDIAVLYKNWDEVVVNQLETVDVFGSRYDRANKINYQNFPCAFFMSFNKKSFDVLNKFDYDIWIPANKGKTLEEFGYVWTFTKDYSKSGQYLGLQMDEKFAKIFNKKVGDIMYADTGFKIPVICYANNLKANCIHPTKIKTKHFCDWPDVQKRRLGEWEYEGEPFMVHLSQSRRKYTKSSCWKNCCISYIENHYDNH